MKTALFSILAKHAYAQSDGPGGSGHMAAETSLAAHPVTVDMTVTAVAGDVNPHWIQETHDLYGSINDANATYSLQGTFAKNYVDDLNILMDNNYHGHISATVDIELVGENGAVLSSHMNRDFECAGDGELDGSAYCQGETEYLFEQTTAFDFMCSGVHVHGSGQYNAIDPTDGSANTGAKFTAGDSTLASPATPHLLTSGSGKGNFAWSSSASGYSNACEFALDYQFDVRVTVRVFESADENSVKTQIGAALRRTVPISVHYSFEGYGMTPNYVGVANQIASYAVTGTQITDSSGVEHMEADVNNTVDLLTVPVSCDSTLTKRGATTVIDAIWVYHLVVDGCTRDPRTTAGDAGVELLDDELLIAPRVVGDKALMSHDCLIAIASAKTPTQASVLAGTDCVLTREIGGSAARNGAECEGTEETDKACLQWSGGLSGDVYVTTIDGNVHESPGPKELKVALARYDSDTDVNEEGRPQGNAFGLWFYVRLSDPDFAGSQSTMKITLPLEASAL